MTASFLLVQDVESSRRLIGFNDSDGGKHEEVLPVGSYQSDEVRILHMLLQIRASLSKAGFYLRVWNMTHAIVYSDEALIPIQRVLYLEYYQLNH